MTRKLVFVLKKNKIKNEAEIPRIKSIHCHHSYFHRATMELHNTFSNIEENRILNLVTKDATSTYNLVSEVRCANASTFKTLIWLLERFLGWGKRKVKVCYLSYLFCLCSLIRVFKGPYLSDSFQSPRKKNLVVRFVGVFLGGGGGIFGIGKQRDSLSQRKHLFSYEMLHVHSTG